MPKTILVLAANPRDTARLRLDQEVREISNGLRRSRMRDQFVLRQEWAPRPEDVRRAMLDYQPNIVHFCGHGGTEGIFFEDEQGRSELVDSETLADFFKLFADTVECVLLNACYSEEQAKAIARHIDYVIGMRAGISDEAAIEFAVAFYDALGAGRDIKFAYKLACNAIQWQNSLEKEKFTPVLIIRKPSLGEDDKSTEELEHSSISPLDSLIDTFIKESLAEQKISYTSKPRLIKGNGPATYLLVGNMRHWLPDGPTVVRLRKKLGPIEIIDDTELELYPRGRDLPSLCPRIVETPQGERYLLIDGVYRRIMGEETLLALGGHPKTIPIISYEELAKYKQGEDIPEQVGKDALSSMPHLVKSVYPEIYFVRGSIKRWVTDQFSLQRIASQFRIPGIERIEIVELEKFIEGLPIGHPFVPLL